MAKQSTIARQPAPTIQPPAPVELMPVKVGDMVLFVGPGAPAPAIATSDQNGTKLSLTYFPAGIAPVALTGVEEDPDGLRKFSWHRRG